MPTTLSGVWGNPLEVLVDMVAASTTFLSWTGAANAAAAESGHCRIFTDFNFDSYPLALVKWQQGTKQGSKGVTAGRPVASQRVDGCLAITFYNTYSASEWNDPQELMKAFADKVYGVIEDLQDMSGGEGMLPLCGYEPETEEPGLTEFEDGKEEPVVMWKWCLSF